MAESKVQKVARKAGAVVKLPSCRCGGEVVWARLEKKMIKACMKCGEEQRAN